MIDSLFVKNYIKIENKQQIYENKIKEFYAQGKEIKTDHYFWSRKK